MSRTNFFAALDSDDEESRDGADTRKQATVTRLGGGDQKRVGQTAAYVEESHSWGDIMTGMTFQPNIESAKKTKPVLTLLHVDFCDEPWKYGTDIEDRWDEIAENTEMGQYWQERDTFALKPVPNFSPIARECANTCAKRWAEKDIKNHVARITNAVITIQRMVRGYQAKCRNPHLDCCMCLSHVHSPLKTDTGYMCRDCAKMGPHEDIFPNDPTNWSRTDYVDMAPNGKYVYEFCGWCVHEYFAPLWNGDYCSYDCEWKDRTA